MKNVGLHFDDKLVVVNVWTSDCKFDKKKVATVDVWVQFPG